MANQKCVSCNKSITKKSPGLECSRCSKTVHATPTCSKISNKLLTALRGTNGLEWSCEECMRNMSKRSSFLTPDEDTDVEDNDMMAGLGSRTSVIDPQKLAMDISREVKKAIKDELGNLQHSLEFVGDQVSNIDKVVMKQDLEIKALKKYNQDLQNRNKNLELRLSVLEQQVQVMTQKQLSNTIEICGIPEVPQQKVESVVKRVAEKLDMDTDNVQCVKRLTARNDQPGLLLAEMKTKMACTNWVLSSRNKELTVGDVFPETPREMAANRIYVREALTQEIKSLLFNSKQKLRSTFKYIWCKEGRVLARKTDGSKVIHIRSLHDIESLVST